jgi:hypothetical protein
MPYRAGAYDDRASLMHEIRREGVELYNSQFNLLTRAPCALMPSCAAFCRTLTT